MTFRDFSTEDFLQHPGFRKWVLEQDEAEAAFWADWMRQHPEKGPDVLKAKEILQLIAEEHTPAASDEAETWNRIQQTIGSAAVMEMPRKKSLIRRLMPYAAVLAAIIVAVYAAWLFYAPAEVQYNTAMGELKTIELPDHSIIRLNVNSNIRYANDWNKDRPREIWLEGEAFFSVTHQQNDQPFIVHTNDVDIQVLGTEFNVNTRRVQTQVVLAKGKVQLKLNGPNAKPITMKPGDMVVYSATTAALTNKQVDPEAYASWRIKELRFNEATIAEVIRSLHDNMGITIELADTAIGSQTFTGTIPLDNIEVFFRTLSRSFDLQTEQTGTKTYRIK